MVFYFAPRIIKYNHIKIFSFSFPSNHHHDHHHHLYQQSPPTTTLIPIPTTSHDHLDIYRKLK